MTDEIFERASRELDRVIETGGHTAPNRDRVILDAATELIRAHPAPALIVPLKTLSLLHGALLNLAESLDDEKAPHALQVTARLMEHATTEASAIDNPLVRLRLAVAEPKSWWTGNPPTEPGLYWVREFGVPDVARVRDDGTGTWYEFPGRGALSPEQISERALEWWPVPIEPPNESK